MEAAVRVRGNHRNGLARHARAKIHRAKRDKRRSAFRMNVNGYRAVKARRRVSQHGTYELTSQDEDSKKVE